MPEHTDLGDKVNELGVKFAQVEVQMDQHRSELHRVSNAITTLQSEFRSGLDRLSVTLNSKSEPKWGTIWTAAGVVIASLSLLGALAYLPIVGKQTDLVESVREFSKTVVYSTRYDHDRDVTDNRLHDKADKDILVIMNQNLQHQIDDLKRK